MNIKPQYCQKYDLKYDCPNNNVTKCARRVEQAAFATVSPTRQRVKNQLSKRDDNNCETKYQDNSYPPTSKPVYDEHTPVSIMDFTSRPAEKGILAGTKKIDPAEILAGLTTFTFAKVPPPPRKIQENRFFAGQNSTGKLSEKRTKRKKSLVSSSNIVNSTNKGLPSKRRALTNVAQETSASMTYISGHDMFKNDRKSCLQIFGRDLAKEFKDVKLPFCPKQQCAFVPTGVWMSKKNDRQQIKVKYTSARLWLAVRRQDENESENRLFIRPAILNRP